MVPEGCPCRYWETYHKQASHDCARVGCYDQSCPVLVPAKAEYIQVHNAATKTCQKGASNTPDYLQLIIRASFYHSSGIGPSASQVLKSHVLGPYFWNVFAP